MKKAKLILGVIAVFAVVGTTLAFKAQKFGTFRLYTSVGNSCVFSTTVAEDQDATPLQHATILQGVTDPTLPIENCDNESAKFDINN